PAPSASTPSPPAAPAPASRDSASSPATSDVLASDVPTTRRTDDDDEPTLRPRRPRWLLPLAVAALLALGVIGLRRLDHAPPSSRAAERSLPSQPAPALEPAQPSEASPEPPSPAPEATPAGLADSNPDPTTPAAPVPPSDGSQPSGPGAAITRINVVTDPPGARLFWKGKEVGTTPFVLELPSGQRRSFELGKPGFITRKVVIDGSKTDITIGLRPDSPAPAGARPRK
ncbi:MAG TPA: hypothetical protein VIW29_20735, partial [Polyangiaceae bacterium]